jgi:hypothetical protein
MPKIIAMFTEFHPLRGDAVLIRPKLDEQIVWVSELCARFRIRANALVTLWSNVSCGRKACILRVAL